MAVIAPPAPANLVRPRVVLFDWDNTLVENWLSIQAAMNAALADADRAPFDLEQVMFQARHSAREVFPRLFGESWPRARDIFYAHFAAHHLAGLRVMPGAEALILGLREKGVLLGIVSNKKGDMLRREIAHLGWSGHFATVVGAQDAPADKPDPAPVHMALDRISHAPARDIWLVGDTDIDMGAASAAGCCPVLVGPGPSDPTLLEAAPPALRCHNCIELMGFLRVHWDTISMVHQQ